MGSPSNTENDTVDGERFAGLNIRGFSAIKFTKILSRCLGHKCSLFSTIKERHLYLWKNLHSIPEKHEKCESLAQQIFPHLRYFKVLQLHCKHARYGFTGYILKSVQNFLRL